ncbi:hypothetical protein CHLRE_06g285950v5 [Chlamydomonas reinhardtii]|uniref:Uncharacterized protein n=1 Tax=Chlamydomonas reinhardtii TaxID=3055 RepID=A0A2K3DPZ2_CHLRE|nr:uncharacterized protein CHLRE_06g285950v5 [Chlamydomonas reinhardtii]PNW82609.1 hypothetical protein CHLRE_06g285950v5 [Chlamydomonas reinhardtii]
MGLFSCFSRPASRPCKLSESPPHSAKVEAKGRDHASPFNAEELYLKDAGVGDLRQKAWVVHSDAPSAALPQQFSNDSARALMPQQLAPTSSSTYATTTPHASSDGRCSASSCYGGTAANALAASKSPSSHGVHTADGTQHDAREPPAAGPDVVTAHHAQQHRPVVRSQQQYMATLQEAPPTRSDGRGSSHGVGRPRRMSAYAVPTATAEAPARWPITAATRDTAAHQTLSDMRQSHMSKSFTDMRQLSKQHGAPAAAPVLDFTAAALLASGRVNMLHVHVQRLKQRKDAAGLHMQASSRAANSHLGEGGRGAGGGDPSCQRPPLLAPRGRRNSLGDGRGSGGGGGNTFYASPRRHSVDGSRGDGRDLDGVQQARASSRGPGSQRCRRSSADGGGGGRTFDPVEARLARRADAALAARRSSGNTGPGQQRPQPRPQQEQLRGAASYGLII